MALAYFAMDGNYGEVQNALIVETDQFTTYDWEAIDNARDNERCEVAFAIAKKYDGLRGPVIPVDENELPQMLETLEAVIAFLTRSGSVGWAAELGDIRDVLERSGVSLDS